MAWKKKREHWNQEKFDGNVVMESHVMATICYIPTWWYEVEICNEVRKAVCVHPYLVKYYMQKIIEGMF